MHIYDEFEYIYDITLIILHYAFVTGDVSNPESTIELTVFQETYAMLCNTITEIKDILQYFKIENIITTDEEEEIKNIATNPEKTKRVMLNVLASLKAGNNNKFYDMLKVMKNHGFMATQNLADLMTTRLKVSSKLIILLSLSTNT